MTEVEKSFEAFVRWYESHKSIKIIAVEQVIYSENFDYAGTLDCIAEINGKLTMIDFKTSNPRMIYKGGKPSGQTSFYPEHMIQCAAYDQAYSEETGLKSEQYMIVYVTKTGKLYTYTLDNTEEARTAWACAISLARYYKQLENISQMS